MKLLTMLVCMLFTLTSCTVTRTAAQSDAPRTASQTTVVTAPELGMVTPPVLAGTPEAMAVVVFGAIAAGDVVTLQQHVAPTATGDGMLSDEIGRWSTMMAGSQGGGRILTTSLSTEQRGATTVVHGVFQHERRTRTMTLSLTATDGGWQVIGWERSHMVTTFPPSS